MKIMESVHASGMDLEMKKGGALLRVHKNIGIKYTLISYYLLVILL